MGSNVEKKLSIMARVSEPLSRWSSQRNATEDERPSIVSEIGASLFALFADEADGLDTLEIPLTEGDLRRRKRQ